MSEAVSALGGQTWSAGIADIAEIGPLGMITLRGDLTDVALQGAAKAITGTAFPDQGQAAVEGDKGICWMSPDEVLILCPYADVAALLDNLNTSLAGTHFLAVDVSDARAVFTLSGPQAREVMAKLTPVDMAAEALPLGAFRRSKLAQVAAAFWMADSETCKIICFRSTGQYMFDLLKVAAQPGSEVSYLSQG